MALTLTPWACDTSSDVHQAEIVRRSFAAVVGEDGGVVDAEALAVSAKSGTPNMSVDVAAGFAFVPGDATQGGVFGVHNDATVNVAVTAADPSNPRITSIILAVDNTTNYEASIVAVDGTPAAIPTAPTITEDNYLLLANVEVPASASSVTNADITDERTLIPSPLQIVTSGTRPSPARDGQLIWETDTDHLAVWSSGWEVVNRQPDEIHAVATFTPGGNSDTTSSTPADWGGGTTITVPSWATTADVVAVASGVFPSGADGSNIVHSVSIGSGVGAVFSDGVRTATFGSSSTPRGQIVIAKRITGIPTGSQALRWQAQRINGVGFYRADTNCDFDFQVTFS